MSIELRNLIAAAGAGQLCVLFASALVPVRLEWRAAFAPLSKLHRQLYWVYGGYVVLAIIANGLISLSCADELAAGGRLGRAFCGYVAIFWGIRLTLQAALDADPFLTTRWLKLGYHILTALFASFTAVFGWAAIRPLG